MFTERNTDGTVSPLMYVQADLGSRRRQSPRILANDL